jgi:hypothetical protein
VEATFKKKRLGRERGPFGRSEETGKSKEGERKGNGWVNMTREHYIYEDVKMETIILLVNM